MDKEKAIEISKDIILRVIKDKFDIKDELAIISELKESNETILFYLKDIRKLIEKLINTIEEWKQEI